MSSIPSPLAGRVVAIHAQPGETVAEGGVLLIVESMKMEIPVEAEAPGTVARVLVAVGDEVQEGQPLVELGGPR